MDPQRTFHEDFRPGRFCGFHVHPGDGKKEAFGIRVVQWDRGEWLFLSGIMYTWFGEVARQVEHWPAMVCLVAILSNPICLSKSLLLMSGGPACSFDSLFPILMNTSTL